MIQYELISAIASSKIPAGFFLVSQRAYFIPKIKDTQSLLLSLTDVILTANIDLVAEAGWSEGKAHQRSLFGLDVGMPV